jgi:hypothetical protein
MRWTPARPKREIAKSRAIEPPSGTETPSVPIAWDWVIPSRVTARALKTEKAEAERLKIMIGEESSNWRTNSQDRLVWQVGSMNVTV